MVVWLVDSFVAAGSARDSCPEHGTHRWSNLFGLRRTRSSLRCGPLLCDDGYGGVVGMAAWGFRAAGVALILFLVQLVLNALWSYFFFGLHRARYRLPRYCGSVDCDSGRCRPVLAGGSTRRRAHVALPRLGRIRFLPELRPVAIEQRPCRLAQNGRDRREWKRRKGGMSDRVVVRGIAESDLVILIDDRVVGNIVGFDATGCGRSAAGSAGSTGKGHRYRGTARISAGRDAAPASCLRLEAQHRLGAGLAEMRIEVLRRARWALDPGTGSGRGFHLGSDRGIGSRLAS